MNSKAKIYLKRITSQYRSYGVHIKLMPLCYFRRTKLLIYFVLPQTGAKVKAIFRYAEDIKIAMSLELFYPFSTGKYLFIAVSNDKVALNDLRQILDNPAFDDQNGNLLVALGYDFFGKMHIVDLAEMPHAMYAGATNSGKSMGLICLILSLIYYHSVNSVNLILCDMGGRSLSVFEDIPHLSHPIVYDEKTGEYVISSLFQEMERRLALNEEEIRDLPSIVCVIDEFVSFMDHLRNIPDNSITYTQITDILRRGRKAKVHMVIATQDTKSKSMCVETNNITTRMAFKCATYQASINILNCRGAENLSGKGEMLYVSAEHPTPTWIQGAYMPPLEVRNLVSLISSEQSDSSKKFIIPEASMEPLTIESDRPTPLPRKPLVSKHDKERASVIMWALGNDTLSTECIKSHFSMGNRAKDIMAFLTEQKIISPPHGKLARKILVSKPDQLPENILSLLHICGYSDEAIKAAIGNRFGEDHSDAQSIEARLPDEG